MDLLPTLEAAKLVQTDHNLILDLSVLNISQLISYSVCFLF